MRLIEIPGPTIFNLDAVAVASYEPARFEGHVPLDAKLELVLIAGPRLTLVGPAAIAVWQSLKAISVPIVQEQAGASHG